MAPSAKKRIVWCGLAAAAAAAVVAGTLLPGRATRGEGKPSIAEIMKRMKYYGESLGVGCDYCHVPDSKSIGGVRADIVTPRMKTAKWMETEVVGRLVTRDGHQPIDCHTCHDGRARFLPSSQ
jgi:hypothetical protein